MGGNSTTNKRTWRRDLAEAVVRVRARIAGLRWVCPRCGGIHGRTLVNIRKARSLCSDCGLKISVGLVFTSRTSPAEGVADYHRGLTLRDQTLVQRNRLVVVNRLDADLADCHPWVAAISGVVEFNTPCCGAYWRQVPNAHGEVACPNHPDRLWSVRPLLIPAFGQALHPPLDWVIHFHAEKPGQFSTPPAPAPAPRADQAGEAGR